MERYTLNSPDGSRTLSIALENGRPTYTVRSNNEQIVEASTLGLTFRDQPALDTFDVVETSREHHDNTWEPVWGAEATIRNHYEQLRLTLVERDGQCRELELVFRAYNDGIAFRYRLPTQPSIGDFAITDELTEFRFAGDFQTWWTPADHDSYEFRYQRTPLSDIDSAHTPLTMQTDNGQYVSLHEAQLLDYAAMAVRQTDETTTLACELEPLPDGSKVKATTPHESPWRTLTLGDRPGALIESKLILNLNDPPAFDGDWITPMKYVGIWWGMHLGEYTWSEGDNHGATTGRTRKYIDFAANHGIEGVLTEGWNVGWEADDWAKQDFTTPMDDFALEELVEYAAANDVQWIAHAETGGDIENFESQLEAAFKRYAELGAAGVKTGYAGPIDEHTHHNQRMVTHHQTVLERAAEHELLLDAHEPVKQTGLRRTYPNLITQEGVRGMEYNAWSPGNPPSHTVTLPFTRMLAGPLDYTPGIFDLTYARATPDDERSVPFQADEQTNYRVQTTRARQLALYPILFSGLQMVADMPENYYDDLDAFAFIESVPAAWDATRVLTGSIGEYVAIARRSDDEWFLGAGTDDSPRQLDLDLSFLDEEREYVAEIYADGPEAHWKRNPEPVTRHTTRVDSTTTLQASLATGGGQAIRFRPLETQPENTELNSYEPPAIECDHILLDHDAAVNSPLEVTAAVENAGNVIGSTELSLFVDGEARSSTRQRVHPAETEAVTFAVTFAEPGEYEITVGPSLRESPPPKTVTTTEPSEAPALKARPVSEQ